MASVRFANVINSALYVKRQHVQSFSTLREMKLLVCPISPRATHTVYCKYGMMKDFQKNLSAVKDMQGSAPALKGPRRRCAKAAGGRQRPLRQPAAQEICWQGAGHQLAHQGGLDWASRGNDINTATLGVSSQRKSQGLIYEHFFKGT